MTLFHAYPTYLRLRAMHTPDQGEDVYALQTALNAIQNAGLVLDGAFGPKTSTAVRAFQTAHRPLKVDGIAGGATQQAAAFLLADKASDEFDLPTGLLKGQLIGESGCWLGNYSPKRPDGTYDAGVAQRNTKQTAAKQGFDAPASVRACGAHMRDYYNRYTTVTDMRRRWGLAAGAWNAPAFANYLAGLPHDTAKPDADDRAKLEAYIRNVTVYMVV